MDQATCHWCGNTPVTAEHLFPEWLDSLVVDGGTVVLHKTDGRGGSKSYESGRIATKRVTRRNVCATCNGGWISRLDTQAKDALFPTLADPSLTWNPTPAQQIAVAEWALCKVITAVEGEGQPEPLTADERKTWATSPLGCPITHYRMIACRLDCHAHFALDMQSATTTKVSEDAYLLFSYRLGSIGLVGMTRRATDRPDLWDAAPTLPAELLYAPFIMPPRQGTVTLAPDRPVSNDTLRDFLRPLMPPGADKDLQFGACSDDCPRRS